jgi:hypothetical protein
MSPQRNISAPSIQGSHSKADDGGLAGYLTLTPRGEPHAIAMRSKCEARVRVLYLVDCSEASWTSANFANLGPDDDPQRILLKQSASVCIINREAFTGRTDTETES